MATMLKLFTGAYKHDREYVACSGRFYEKRLVSTPLKSQEADGLCTVGQYVGVDVSVQSLGLVYTFCHTKTSC